MIDTSKFGERFLQRYRFRMALPYLDGDTMDFGGNEGELRPFVKGDYLAVNYDHGVMKDRKFNTIVALAVIEHIEVNDVYKIFGGLASEHLKDGGKIVLTTPTRMAKPILEVLSTIGLIGKENIEEHKHYWSKRDIYELAQRSGMRVKSYRKFQLGANQFAVFEQA